MTPENVADDIITTDTLFPWLLAIAPAVEPVRPLQARASRSAEAAESSAAPLRPAA